MNFQVQTVSFMQDIPTLLGTITYPVPAGTFESMIFRASLSVGYLCSFRGGNVTSLKLTYPPKNDRFPIGISPFPVSLYIFRGIGCKTVSFWGDLPLVFPWVVVPLICWKSSSASLGVLGEAGAAVLSWKESRGESHPPPGISPFHMGFFYIKWG